MLSSTNEYIFHDSHVIKFERLNDFFLISKKIMMEADLKTVQTELLDETELSLAKEDTNFFDYLHLSPLKVNNLVKSSFFMK